ncbi:MAG: hypothetical protein WCZ72_02800 [Gemmobacter sp.]
MKHPPDSQPDHALAVELIAVVASVTGGDPCVLTLRGGEALPSGPFALGHRSLQAGLRDWVEQQTGHPLGYIEQLYTFADRDRLAGDPANGGAGNPTGAGARRTISISYLGLARDDPQGTTAPPQARGWCGWYGCFPWEDHRAGPPPVIAREILPRLAAWADTGPEARGRHERSAVAFGLDGRDWNEELVLQRYELLYEAGLVEEARRAGISDGAPPLPGRAMVADHRRILATGIARLRTKIKYRPVVFELMPPVFTLLQLQRAVEALAGRLVHKQNFRRLIEQQDLVEDTGETSSETGGRPAKLFRFRAAVQVERIAVGTKLPVVRS